jgi:hypothetical protein
MLGMTAINPTISIALTVFLREVATSSFLFFESHITPRTVNGTKQLNTINTIATKSVAKA